MIRLSNIAPVTILFISLLTVFRYNLLGISFGTTPIWIVSFGVLAVFIVLPFYSKNKNTPFLIKLLIAYYIFSLVRGIFISKIYWDYKSLVNNGLSMLLILVAVTALNLGMVRKILIFYLKYTFPLIILLVPFIKPSHIGLFMIPLAFLIFFFPVLPRLWKVILPIAIVLSILADVGARSSLIRVSVSCLILVGFYYIPLFRSRNLMNAIRIIFFIIPIIFFWLGVTGKFVVFKFDEYIDYELKNDKVVEGKNYQEDLKADTRTFIYEENLLAALKHNSWWIGRSPARGYETLFFKDEMIENYGRPERPQSEVAILNIFIWMGIVGVILYFMVFFQASYLAINKSNNIFSQMLGVFIAFRWLYAWIEDVNYFTSLTYILWLTIGLCYSKKFRLMTNLEIRLWVKGIPYKKINNSIIIKKLNSI